MEQRSTGRSRGQRSQSAWHRNPNLGETFRLSLSRNTIFALMILEVGSLFWFLLCCKLIFHCHCAHWLLPLQRQATHPFLWTSPRELLLFLHLSLFSALFLAFSARSKCGLCPALFSSILLSFLSSCRRGTQPNVKRGNLTVSLASAAFTPTVCTTRKVK